MTIDFKDRFLALLGDKKEQDIIPVFFMYMFRRFGAPHESENILGGWVLYHPCKIIVSFTDLRNVELTYVNTTYNIPTMANTVESFIQSLLHSVDLQEHSFNIFGECTPNMLPYFAPKNIVENTDSINYLLFRQSCYYFKSLLETALFGECRYNIPIYSVNEKFVDKWHLVAPTLFCYLFKRYGIDVNTITDYDICTFKVPTNMQGVYLRIIFKSIDYVHIDCIIDTAIQIKTDRERVQLNRLFKQNFKQFCIDNDLPINLDCMNKNDLIAAYNSYLEKQGFEKDVKLSKADNDKYSELFYKYYEKKQEMSFEKFSTSPNYIDRLGATKTVTKAIQACGDLINSFLDAIQIGNSEINAKGCIDLPKFVMVVGDNLPHLNGFIYAVKDSDNEYTMYSRI